MSFFSRLYRFASLPNTPCDAGADKTAPIRFVCAFLFLSVLFYPFPASSLEPNEADQLPHVGQQGRDGFIHYVYADTHKAFAIAPGGAWAWSSGELSQTIAEQKALSACQEHSEQTCVLYSLDDRVVFDGVAWSKLWRLPHDINKNPTPDRIRRGQVFPNLEFRDVEGKVSRLRDLTGNITLVHFWGSWCSPCLREMPGLLRLQEALKSKHDGQVKLVLLQVREPFYKSVQWAKQRNFSSLPIFDSGARDSTDTNFRTADGRSLPDRRLARVFPTSYVLDRKQRVLFSHYGPVSDWQEYLPFFTDVIRITN